MKLDDIEKLRIVNYPAPVLLQVAQPVERFDEALAKLAERMLELMRAADGVGLAAPQVGIPLRMFVCNATQEPDNDLVIVNPKFLSTDGAADGQEGCLSLPNVTVTVRRATHVSMEAKDEFGNDLRLVGVDLLARVWQHETDHLDGKLILDYQSPSDEIANRRAIKQLKDDYAGAKR